jgi:hypothetical protein
MHPDFPINYLLDGIYLSCGRNGLEEGDLGEPQPGPCDLVELVEYADGFKPWAGGEQPTETVGKTVWVLRKDTHKVRLPADLCDWKHNDSHTDIVAYSLGSLKAEPPVEPADGFTACFGGGQPEETRGREVEILTLHGPAVKGPADKFGWTDEHVNPIRAYRIVGEPELQGGKLQGDHYYRVRVDAPMSTEVPPYVAECSDIIEALNMTFNEGEAFKAIWRLAASRQGRGKPGNKAQYDADKAAHYGSRIAAQTKVLAGKAV